MPPTIPSKEKSYATSVPALVIIFLILIGVSIWMYTSGIFVPKTPVAVQEGITQTASKETTTVRNVDLTQKTNRDQLPLGFPKNIPVDTSSRLTQSYVLAFPERNMSQYTAGFTTKETVVSQYKLYLDFMTNSGYLFAADGKNLNTSLYGTKDNDDLSVVFSNQNGITNVSISYLDRQ